MSPYFYYLPIAIIAGIIYMIIMNKRYKEAKAEVNLEKERSNYDLYKQELLNNNFSKLKKWMKDSPIDAFTSASVPQSTTNKVKEFVGDGLKNVALSAFGVKLKRVNTDCFWVLSNNDLHLLITDIDGYLEEYLIFDQFRIEKATLEYTGILKSEIGIYSKEAEEFLPKVHQIIFDIDGSPLALEIHDRLRYQVNPSEILNQKKQLLDRAKYKVVGEHFIEALQAKYPNLKTT